MRKFGRLPIYLALILVSVLFLFPFYWAIASSLMSVEGMGLKPPSLYPAEAKTASVSIPTSGRVVSAGGYRWVRLARSADRMGSGGDGAYYLQLDPKGKPSQLVGWFADRDIESVSFAAAALTIPKAPVERVGNREVTVLAKMVRQTDQRYNELLLTVPATQSTVGEANVMLNVDHHDIRSLRPHWENYPQALKGPEASIGGKSQGFLLFMRNSFFISGMAVIGQVLASSLVAFGFARLSFRGRDALFVFVIATLMVPGQVTLIPLFTIYKTLGWIDTFWPLILPHFTAGAFNIFLIRQFLLTVPRELDESASIDGATPFTIYRKIILPLCAPVLIVVGLFTFVGTWQDVQGPLIYLDNPAYRTVTLGLEYFRSPYVDNRPLLMAGAVMSMIPVAALFLVGQRYIMSGIATTGLK